MTVEHPARRQVRWVRRWRRAGDIDPHYRIALIRAARWYRFQQMMPQRAYPPPVSIAQMQANDARDGIGPFIPVSLR